MRKGLLAMLIVGTMVLGGCSWENSEESKPEYDHPHYEYTLPKMTTEEITLTYLAL